MEASFRILHFNHGRNSDLLVDMALHKELHCQINSVDPNGFLKNNEDPHCILITEHSPFDKNLNQLLRTTFSKVPVIWVIRNATPSQIEYLGKNSQIRIFDLNLNKDNYQKLIGLIINSCGRVK